MKPNWEGLRKVCRGLPAVTGLLYKISIAEHLFEQQTDFFEVARARQRFDRPEGPDTERPLACDDATIARCLGAIFRIP